MMRKLPELLCYLVGALMLGGVLKASVDTAGWLLAALFIGWLAWLQFGKDEGK
jgi:hypothetical protein